MNVKIEVALCVEPVDESDLCEGGTKRYRKIGEGGFIDAYDDAAVGSSLTTLATTITVIGRDSGARITIPVNIQKV